MVPPQPSSVPTECTYGALHSRHSASSSGFWQAGGGLSSRIVVADAPAPPSATLPPLSVTLASCRHLGCDWIDKSVALFVCLAEGFHGASCDRRMPERRIRQRLQARLFCPFVRSCIAQCTGRRRAVLYRLWARGSARFALPARFFCCAHGLRPRSSLRARRALPPLPPLLSGIASLVNAPTNGSSRERTAGSDTGTPSSFFHAR